MFCDISQHTFRGSFLARMRIYLCVLAAHHYLRKLGKLFSSSLLASILIPSLEMSDDPKNRLRKM